ncbi:MAG: hypothetical protein H0W89_00135 [Candidatus Levybacteria bacterium]|nr:hypothetical protein [Candidatus Levybacteria bacterium]
MERLSHASPDTKRSKKFDLPFPSVRKTSITVQDERPQEECGLLTFYSLSGITKTEVEKLFAGAEGIQQRGQQGAGITVHAMNGESFIHRGHGLLDDAFPKTARDQVMNLGTLRSASVQTRYSTDGGFEKENLHPIVVGEYEVMANGNFSNKDALRRQSGKTYDFDPSDTKVWSDVLPTIPGETQDDKIVNAVHGSVGAASLVINVGDETQYVAKDPKGVRPLVLGQMEGELGTIYVVASETVALEKINATVVRDIRPGEVIKFDSTGMTVLEKGDKSEERMCSLEHAYLSDPDSQVNVTSNGASPETWPRHGENRTEVGRQMAREEKARQRIAKKRAEKLGEPYKEFKPDIVVGMPSSGIPYGKGYAEEMGAVYRQLIEKDPENKTRMFQADEEKDQRRAGIRRKVDILTPDDWAWEDKDVVITEDTMVRGDAAYVLAEILTELGARLHLRIGYPQIINPCHLGVNMKTHDELMAYRMNGDVTEIAKEIGAASVEFVSSVGFVRAIQGDHFEETSKPKDVFDINRMCGGCVTKKYPYPPAIANASLLTAQAS